MTNPTTPTPGWYDDGTGQQRYWDGAQWTEHTAPLAQSTTSASSTEQQASAGTAPTASVSPAATIPSPSTAAATAQPLSAIPADAPTPPAAPHKRRNVLGLVAFIVAVVGFVFACIPGALIVGWILLPIAFILSIVALFFKGQSKALALTGLILSVVGTIVAFIVFFAVVANSFNDAFGGTASSVIQTDAPKASAAAKDDAGANKADAGTSKVGTRDNPAAIGSVIKGNDYTVTINSVNLNATDAILAANQFNEAPADGTVYALINATVTYTGNDSGLAALVGIAYVSADGNVFDSLNKIVIAPDPQLGADELYNGASATGNIAIQIPAAADGLIRVRPGVIADEVFVKTK